MPVTAGAKPVGAGVGVPVGIGVEVGVGVGWAVGVGVGLNLGGGELQINPTTCGQMLLGTGLWWAPIRRWNGLLSSKCPGDGTRRGSTGGECLKSGRASILGPNTMTPCRGTTGRTDVTRVCEGASVGEYEWPKISTGGWGGGNCDAVAGTRSGVATTATTRLEAAILRALRTTRETFIAHFQ